MCTSVVQNFIKHKSIQYNFENPAIDIGSGDEYVRYFPLFKNLKIDKLDLCQNAHKNINIIADITKKTPIQEGQYKTILFFETLEHISDPMSTFQEIARIAAPNALLLGSTVACWPEHKHPKDYYRFLPDGIEFLLFFADFEPLEIIMDPKNAQIASHTLFIAKKNNKTL